MAKNWNCIDCNELIWNRYLRCKSCASKGKNNPNFGKGLFEKDNPNWRGGVSKNPYTTRFKRTLRPIVRDIFKTCQYCATNENLEVHHIDENPKNNSLENLITTCHRCNIKAHFNPSFYSNWFKYKHFMKFRMGAHYGL